MSDVPASRISALRVTITNQALVRSDGRYVLYWMTAARRTTWNFALQRAVEWATHLKRPLVVFEPLRCDYQWASERFHAFVVQGMADNAAACTAAGVTYLPYVEDVAGNGRGLLEHLASEAAVVIGDDYPYFFLPRMVAAAAVKLPVRFEVVDGNGLLPLRATVAASATAYAFRRILQKNLRPHLDAMPLAEPLKRAPKLPLPTLPTGWGSRWRAADPTLFSGSTAALAHLPIDHAVGVVGMRGGSTAAEKQLTQFLANGLARYHEDRNVVDDSAASGLSPWLHFGHLSAHQAVANVLAREAWSPQRLGSKADGKREGWWGVTSGPESFLDELVTWRELGHHYCFHRPAHETYEDLPAWARATLEAHAQDPREHVYTVEQFADARTHDPLWNAAQRELRSEGRMHNYLRMLWGKKVLEWTRHPREALAILTELNNRYAVDGRDPNSSSGISWCLGRFDRPWAPQRPIFGQIRYMSSANTLKKIRLKGYLERYGERGAQQHLF
ncbi:MAG: deoxyribodipyrimidine photolyase [Planctomycetes bacterium]|nr:deoxyribodipyrimidine photolyase [Planctomycetota bacterium]